MASTAFESAPRVRIGSGAIQAVGWGVCLLQLALFAWLAPSLEKATLRVPSRFETIQAAIRSARDGDCVLVAPGDYSGPIDFLGKRVAIRSEQGPTVTRIAAPDDRHVVLCVHGEPWPAVLDGFTLRGGGGVLCRGSAPTLRRNRIESAGPGPDGSKGLRALAGVLCTAGSAPALFDNRVSGRGIVCEDSTILLRGNRIHRCRGTDGGAVCCRRSSVRIEANVIRENHATGRGGGVFASRSRVVSVNNVVADNRARTGGGLYVEGGSLEALHNTIIGNTATTGGGFVSREATVEVVNAILWNNTAVTAPEIQARGREPRIAHSIVQGNWRGEAVLDRDPGLVADGGDFHLTFGSPARGRGLVVRERACRLDIDGNDRFGDGRVDLGADEFAPHLYAHRSTPDGPVTAIRAIGSPGTPVLLGSGSSFISSPLQYPGFGFCWLLTPVTLLPVQDIPPSGWVSLPVPPPKAPPPGATYPVQAWIGRKLSPPVVLRAPR